MNGFQTFLLFGGSTVFCMVVSPHVRALAKDSRTAGSWAMFWFIAISPIMAVVFLIALIRREVAKRSLEREVLAEQARISRAAQEAAAKRRAEEKARQEKQQRINDLGEENAKLVESALAAVKQVRASEAVREGWLGDVDFTADIQEITDNFQKAHALRQVAKTLSALDRPSDDDRRILAEASDKIADLELTATERVKLILQWVKEARLIDKSLSDERKDAQTEEQRAELHAKLGAMLYGIEAAPKTVRTDSAADAVTARVQAYREIRNQIKQARGS